MCGDINVSRKHAFKACSEVIGQLCEALCKTERQKRASDQKSSVLVNQLKVTEDKLAKLKEHVEVLEGSSAFYGDEKSDASISYRLRPLRLSLVGLSLRAQRSTENFSPRPPALWAAPRSI
ncbi:hypothetical protein ATANTOWER_025340 [Ataeniobius toweri]|uniref:Uncharacterized protein n=1 Tax=Ataeniobius toweri TaxID=208326 RepID=A0ABU7CAE1_9TELE|nr:hypothetical protein [Ataeniobius toweri]